MKRPALETLRGWASGEDASGYSRSMELGPCLLALGLVSVQECINLTGHVQSRAKITKLFRGSHALIFTGSSYKVIGETVVHSLMLPNPQGYLKNNQPNNYSYSQDVQRLIQVRDASSTRLSLTSHSVLISFHRPAAIHWPLAMVPCVALMPPQLATLPPFPCQVSC